LKELTKNKADFTSYITEATHKWLALMSRIMIPQNNSTAAPTLLRNIEAQALIDVKS